MRSQLGGLGGVVPMLSLMLSLMLSVACSGGGTNPRRPNTNGSPSAGAGPISGAGISGSNTVGGAGTSGGVAGNAGQPFIDYNAPPFVQDDTGKGGVDKATLDELKKGGGACGLTLKYPYDGTMFPGGLQSPTVQWQENVDAVYLHAVYENTDSVDYEFAAAKSMPGEITIPQDAWNEITRRTRNTPLKLTLNVKSGGTVHSCSTTWKIAPGNMSGAIYFNTYNATLPGGMMYGGGAGAVMRLTLGQADPEVYLYYPNTMPSGPCTSCHSVSFNGSTLVAATHLYGIIGASFTVASYPVTTMVQPAETSKLDNAEFGALTPDGKRMLTMGNPDCTAGSDTFPRGTNNMPLVEGPDVARMQDTATGKDLETHGLDPMFYMWMPQFSPDGKHVVFNHAKPDGKGGTDRRELAMMDYDYDTNTFSNLQVLASHIGPEPSLAYSPMGAGGGPTPNGRNGCMAAGGGGITALIGNTGALNPGSCTGPCYPAFPFFTPDSKGVVFSLNSVPDFVGAFPGRDEPALSDLWYVDVASKMVVRLDAANDSHDASMSLMDYFPTVMPVPVGGYFWLFWTSRRDYGTKLGSMKNANMYYSGEVRSVADKKRIWVSAISPTPAGEVTATTVTDPSHPGFYLIGQGDTGNVRAFASLNPCKASGDACISGIDCCGGYCSIKTPGQPGTCTEEKPQCAKTNERCETNDDCCPPTGPDEPKNYCIGGVCAFVNNTPQ